MTVTTTTKYDCDKCGKNMNRPHRTLIFEKDISDLWKPKTWGRVSSQNKHFCESCFDEFWEWLRA